MSSAFSLNIGGDGIYDGGGNWFLGELDDVAIWDVALTEEQVREIFEGRPPHGKGPRGAVFQITALDYDRSEGNVELTWTSRPGESYAVSYSEDFQSFVELDDGIEASEGETTSFVDESVPAGARARYYQVARQE